MTVATYNGHEIPDAMKALSLTEGGAPIPFFMSEGNDNGAAQRSFFVTNKVCAISGKPLHNDVAFICTPDEALSGKFSTCPVLMECADFMMKALPHLAETFAPGGPGFFVVCAAREYRHIPDKDIFETNSGISKTFWDEGRIIPAEIIQSLNNMLGDLTLGE